MTLHLMKLSVGVESLADLADRQGRWAVDGKPYHLTRSMPRRREEILDGGSIYWIIRGQMLARQRILDISPAQRGDGRPATRILLDPGLVAVEPRPARAFQGWRYLKEDAAPADLDEAAADLPPRLRSQLRALGVW